MDEQIDVQIDEQDLTDIGEPTAEELAAGNIDWEARAKEMAGIAKRRTTALKKIKDGGYVKKTAAAPKVEPNNQEPKKDEFGYDKKAFMNSLGFTDGEDHTYVQDMMKSSGKSLEEVLAIPFVKGELTRMKEERTTKAAAAPADGRSGSPARDTVEYWLNKGELPPADQSELRQKVVNAKIAKQRGGNNFSKQSVVGSA